MRTDSSVINAAHLDVLHRPTNASDVKEALILHYSNGCRYIHIGCTPVTTHTYVNDMNSSDISLIALFHAYEPIYHTELKLKPEYYDISNACDVRYA